MTTVPQPFPLLSFAQCYSYYLLEDTFVAKRQTNGSIERKEITVVSELLVQIPFLLLPFFSIPFHFFPPLFFLFFFLKRLTCTSKYFGNTVRRLSPQPSRETQRDRVRTYVRTVSLISTSKYFKVLQSTSPSVLLEVRALLK
jgi:hypothetical protein